MPEIKLREPETLFEAGMMIASGVYFLMIGKKDKRSWAAVGWTIATTFFFTVGKPAAEAWLTDRVIIEEVAPIKADSSDVSDAGLYYAGALYAADPPKGEPIYIKGQLYGYADTSFRTWKIQDVPAVLIHHKSHGEVWKAELPAFDSKVHGK